MTHEVSALPHILTLDSYVPGKPIETLAREKNLTKIIKLASNENPYGPSPHVIETIKNNAATINLYPDPDQFSLKQALANFYNISTDMLAIGNGTDELLRLIMQAFVSQNNNVIIPQYSFISYQICAKSIGATIITTELCENWQNNLEDILKKITTDTKLICLVNPNNPTGSYIQHEILQSFLKRVPNNILIILDEAYIEYINLSSQNAHSNHTIDPSLEFIKQYNNLIITRTFSKIYGLAGIRIGYSIACANITAIINRLKQPFNVNRLAQIAAIAALDDQEYIKKLVAINNSERAKICEHLDKLQINYIMPAANFITINTNNAKNSELIYNRLLDNGIIIRPLNNYGLNNYLRITIGNIEENQYLLTNLSKLADLFRGS